MTPPVQSTVSSMFDLATSFLQVIEAAMATTPAGAPKRAWVAPDTPIFETDCAQAAVYIPTLQEEQTIPLSPSGQVGQRFHRGHVPLVGLVGFAVRCAAVSEGNLNVYQPLGDTSLDDQARAVYEDGWAIWNYLNALLNDASKGFMYGTCGIVHFDQGQPVTHEGGLMGWQFTIRAELRGYIPDLSGFPPDGL